MGLSIGPKIGVEGSEQFRAEFKEMATVARQLKAEMDALTSSFKENDSATVKNQKTKEMLTKQIEQQEKVLAKAKEGVALATKAQENAVQADEKARDKLERLIAKREEAKKALEDSARAHERSKETVTSLAKDVDTLAERLVKVKMEAGENSDAFKELKHNLDYAEKEFQKETKELTKNAKAHTDAQKEVDKLNSDITHQETVIEGTTKGIAKANTVLAEYKTKQAEAQKTLNDLNNELDKTPGKLESVADEMIKYGDAVSSVGETLSKLFAPFTALTAYSTKSALTFTDALAKISTIADTSVVSLEEYSQGIVDLANKTGFATSDIAAATYQALSAAVSTEDSLEFVAGAADLARAGFLDMYGSVDVLTTILNAYHLKVEDVAHISDVLVKTQDRGKTTVNELAGAMGNVIPTAAQYGIKLEDLGAAYVVLTKQGINTARSTTYLRSAFTELEKEGSDASEALKNKTGKSFMQLMKEGKTLGQVMQILRDSVNGDEEAFIHLFGSVRTAAGALALANTSAEEYAEILDDVSNSNGQAARNVEKLQTPMLKLKKAWEQAKNAALDLGMAFLDVLMPWIEKLSKGVKKLSDWFGGLHKSTKKMVAVFVAVAGALGPVTLGIGKTIVLMGNLAKAIAILKTATGALTLQFGAVAAVVTTLIGLFGVMVIKSNEEAEARQDQIKAEWGLTEAMEEHISTAKDLIEQTDGMRKATEEKLKASAEDAEMAKTLLGRLREQYDANGKVIKGKELEAETIKGLLADAMGIEIGQLDKLIEKSGIYSEAIDKEIEQMKKRAEAEVYTEAYKEQFKAMVDLQKKRTDLGNDIIKQNEKYHGALDRVEAAERKINDAESKGLPVREEWYRQLDTATQELAEAENGLNATRDAYHDVDDQIGTTTESLEFYIQGLMESSGMTRQEAEKTAKEWVKDYKTIEDTNRTTIEQIEKDADAGGEEYRQTVERKLNETKGTVNRIMPQVAAEFDIDLTETGNNVTSSYIAGLKKRIGELAPLGAAMAKLVDNSLNAAAETGSPSKVMIRNGHNVADGYIIGLQDRLQTISDMGAALANASMDATSFTNSYSRTGAGYGVMNNNRTISAPISVNVNVNGNLDNPQSLVDNLEEMLVEKIIRNERVFA